MSDVYICNWASWAPRIISNFVWLVYVRHFLFLFSYKQIFKSKMNTHIHKRMTEIPARVKAHMELYID